MIALTIVLVGCQSASQPSITSSTDTNQTIIPTTNTTSPVFGAQNLVLTAQDIAQLGMTSNGTDCSVQNYPNNDYSSLAQYAICDYNITSLNNTDVIIELSKLSNASIAIGAYQYDSSHLRGYQGPNLPAFNGTISNNDYGDMSAFYYSNESTTFYYHLWIVKGLYLIHITSKGDKGAQSYIANIGKVFMSKFN